MTTLYLQKEKNIRLALDGPALVVQVEGQAKRLFPLKRLQQVFVHASLDVSSRVLIGCARAGVVLCFTDARQKPLLWCLGQAGEDNGLNTALQQFMDRTDWESLFQRWLANRRQQLLPGLAQQLGLAREQVDVQEIKSHLARRAIRYAGENQASASAQWLNTEIQGILVSLLSIQAVAEEQAIFWATQLTPLIRWQMEGQRLHWLGQRFTRSRNMNQPLPTLTYQEFMDFFSKNREGLHLAAEHLLGQLSLWVKQPQTEA